MNNALLGNPFRHASTRSLFAPLADMVDLVARMGCQNSVVLGEPVRFVLYEPISRPSLVPDGPAMTVQQMAAELTRIGSQTTAVDAELTVDPDDYPLF
jgi:hypothetical protein